MCVWVNMIVRPGVVIKSLMNISTKKSSDLTITAFFDICHTEERRTHGTQ